MSLYAKDLMVSGFDTINMNAPVEEAVHKISNGKIRKTGYKTISLMVTDDFNKLCGVVTMFDILYHLRPDFLNFGISGEELKWEGQISSLLNAVNEKKVHHIMTPNIVSAKADEHIMNLLDRMIKNKYRRLPVLEKGQPVGVVYLSDIYHHIFSSKAT